MEILGLSGYARSGKDEAAKVLVKEFGYTRVSFADKLREFLYALNPIVAAGPGIVCSEMLKDGIKSRDYVFYLQDVIDVVGWEGYKSIKVGPEIRRLLQRLGTEAGRQTLWDSIWIDAALANVPDDAKVVVTDCRFPNEAQAIKDRGGKVVRINRKDVGPTLSADGTAHPSETSLDDWDFDYTLWNAYSLEQYHEDVRWLVERGWV
jgi:hypothetical protein